MVYKYPISFYISNVLLPIIVMIGLITWASIGTYNEGLTTLNKLIFTVVPVLFLFGFFGISTPGKIIITDKSITFSAYGIKHHFKWNEVNLLQLKGYDSIGKIYIRVGNPTMFKGRYWVNNTISNYLDLREVLHDKYFEVNKIEVDETILKAGEKQS